MISLKICFFLILFTNLSQFCDMSKIDYKFSFNVNKLMSYDNKIVDNKIQKYIRKCFIDGNNAENSSKNLNYFKTLQRLGCLLKSKENFCKLYSLYLYSPYQCYLLHILDDKKWENFLGLVSSNVNSYAPCDSSKCSCHYSTIKNDLKPFKNGITKEMMEEGMEK